MKLNEIIETHQLDEVSLRQAIAAGVIGASALMPSKIGQTSMQSLGQVQLSPQKLMPSAVYPEEDTLTQAVLKKYNIEPELAKDVVQLAYKHEYSDFPKAKDLLAVIGVESSFRPHAKSELPRDPARGLMQVRANVWNVNPEDLHDVELNIQHGSKILNTYYKKFRGNKAAAIQAYNVGETAFRGGDRNPEYLQKVMKELSLYR